jgi:hypothetical protein
MKGFALAAACLLAIAPVGAASAQDYAGRAINDPSPTSLGLYGAQSTIVDDNGVPGGKAFRVTVAGKGANNWDAAVLTGIKQPVKAGDELVFAFWAKLVSAENGATTLTLPWNNVSLSSAPWTGLFGGAVTIGTAWKLYEVRGRADKDYPAGALGASIQVATGKQTIDFGPVYVAKAGTGTSAASVAARPKPTALSKVDMARLPQMLINDPGAPEVNKAKARLVDDPRVTGGKALRVAVAAKGQNPWDSSVSSPIKKPVKAGDKLLLVLWARLEQGPDGATTVTLPAGVSLKSPPWTGLLGGPMDIGPEWKMFEFEGTAPKDYAPGEIGIGFNIATAKQTIDYGPIMLLDLNN